MNCPACNAYISPGTTHACAMGRNCPACSQFIPAGGLHNCAMQPQMQQGLITPQASTLAMSRIATAFENVTGSFMMIATHLGKIAATLEQRLEFEMSYYTEEPDPEGAPDP